MENGRLPKRISWHLADMNAANAPLLTRLLARLFGERVEGDDGTGHHAVGYRWRGQTYAA